jgi:hypothetical protein
MKITRTQNRLFKYSAIAILMLILCTGCGGSALSTKTMGVSCPTTLINDQFKSQIKQIKEVNQIKVIFVMCEPLDPHTIILIGKREGGWKIVVKNEDTGKYESLLWDGSSFLTGQDSSWMREDLSRFVPLDNVWDLIKYDYSQILSLHQEDQVFNLMGLVWLTAPMLSAVTDKEGIVRPVWILPYIQYNEGYFGVLADNGSILEGGVKIGEHGFEEGTTVIEALINTFMTALKCGFMILVMNLVTFDVKSHWLTV